MVILTIPAEKAVTVRTKAWPIQMACSRETRLVASDRDRERKLNPGCQVRAASPARKVKGPVYPQGDADVLRCNLVYQQPKLVSRARWCDFHRKSVVIETAQPEIHNRLQIGKPIAQ